MRERVRSSGGLRWLAAAATVGMFLVLIAGATVTNTGSGEGCGRSWPFCHGRVLPPLTVESIIEYSHRLVTGIEGILIAALAIGAWRGWRQRREVRILVPTMVSFLLLQAGLGAWAVVYGQSPPTMALHFGVSLTAFASVLLLAAFLYEVDGFEAMRDRPVAPGLRRVIWATLGYTYLLVYLGAYVRHTNSALACTDWPLCNGEVWPGLSGPVGIMFAHRLASVAGTLFIAALVVWTWRLRRQRPDLCWSSQIALVLILLQSLSGGWVVLSKLTVAATITHAGLVTLLFGVLSYMAYRTLPLPSAREAVGPASEQPARVLKAGAPPR
ncbi:MAG: heme A synthase [Sphaerobacter sp.]|nr:heme A synthase [Sphaerobacter sp.]